MRITSIGWRVKKNMAKPKKDLWENFGYSLGFGAKP